MEIFGRISNLVAVHIGTITSCIAALSGLIGISRKVSNVRWLRRTIEVFIFKLIEQVFVFVRVLVINDDLFKHIIIIVYQLIYFMTHFIEIIVYFRSISILLLRGQLNRLRMSEWGAGVLRLLIEILLRRVEARWLRNGPWGWVGGWSWHWYWHSGREVHLKAARI